jgi:hypothetical protein
MMIALSRCALIPLHLLEAALITSLTVPAVLTSTAQSRTSVPLQYQQRLKEATNLKLFLSLDQQVSAAKRPPIVVKRGLSTYAALSIVLTLSHSHHTLW